MKCPHCAVEIHNSFTEDWIQNGRIGSENGTVTSWSTRAMECPACEKAIIFLRKYQGGALRTESMAYPRGSVRPKAPPQLPQHIAEDFDEAGLVLDDSPKASAALSRRCLQAVLRDKGYPQHDLAKQIDAVLASKTLPSSLAANVDAIRNIGNFAAHPIKDTNSGAILPVEDHEAEWNLDVLEGLFDYYYVQPARDAARSAALNAKLKLAGKPAAKT